MWMIGTGIDMQLFYHGPAETVLGQHALDRLLQHHLRLLLHKDFVRSFLEPAGISGMGVMYFILHLIAGKNHLFRVDDYDIITHIEVGGIHWLVLALEYFGTLRRQPSYPQLL